MLALHAAIASYHAKAQIVLVASDNDCEGLVAAKQKGLATAFVDYKAQPKAKSEAALATMLKQANVDFILLAGFMQVLSADFVDLFPNQILNIHPSLLPKYKGLNTHQRAIDAGDKTHGASVHIVTAGLDDGPVIEQTSIEILKDDTAESLALRLLPKEHELYGKVVRHLITGTLTIS